MIGDSCSLCRGKQKVMGWDINAPSAKQIAIFQHKIPMHIVAAGMTLNYISAGTGILICHSLMSLELPRFTNSLLPGILTTPDTIRTCNLRFRRPMLCPIELQAPASDGALYARPERMSMCSSAKMPKSIKMVLGSHVCGRKVMGMCDIKQFQFA